MRLRFLLPAAALLLPAQIVLAQPKPAAPSDDPVVAVVNGVELHRSDVVAAQQALPQQYQQLPIEQIYSQLLEQMVTSELVTEAAKKANLADDPEVKKRTAQLQDRVIQDVWIRREVAQAATDKRLHEEYDKYVKNHPPKEEVKASHILVATEDEAKAVIAELEKGGDFAALAKQHSTDPSKDNGGDLGFFSREEMVPEFSEAAFKLAKGEYTKVPVKSQFGWHVIKVEDRRISQPSFEDAKEELTATLTREVITAKIKELHDGAKIQTFALDGSPAPAITLAPDTK
jgi:peptidyl-prolyl cis-trans isomerase C